MKITKDMINIEVIADIDDMPVRGNVIASGNPEYDKRVENRVLNRLNNFDVWAWAQVEVKGTFHGLEASSYIGGCSYKDENDFIKTSGYYDDMVNEVIEELNAQVENIVKAVSA